MCLDAIVRTFSHTYRPLFKKDLILFFYDIYGFSGNRICKKLLNMYILVIFGGDQVREEIIIFCGRERKQLRVLVGKKVAQ